MKQAKLLVIALVALFAVSCGCMTSAAPYDYIQGPGGNQMVVCRDNSGTQFLMDYLLFSTLMRSGGYGAVINNYHTYPGRYTYNPAQYRGYRPFRGASYSQSSWGGYTRSGGPNSSFRTTTTTTNSFNRTTQPGRPTSQPSRPSSSWKSTSPSSSGSSWRSSRSSGSSWRSSGGGSSFRSSSGGRRR